MVCEYAARGHRLDTIASLAGVNRSTLLRWLHEGRKGNPVYQDFAINFDRNKGIFQANLLDDILQTADAKTKLSVLSRYNPQDWASTQKQEIIIQHERKKLLDLLEQHLDTSHFEAVLKVLEDFADEIE